MRENLSHGPNLRSGDSMKQLQLPYSDVDGRFTRIFLPLLFGALAALGIWGLLHWVVQLPSATLPSVLFGLALIPGTWILSWLAIRLAVLSLRSGRGDWWLRLSSAGWEVNDQISGRAAMHESEIDTFMFVAPSAQIEHAVVAPGTTVAEAARNLGARTAGSTRRLSLFARTWSTLRKPALQRLARPHGQGRWRRNGAATGTARSTRRSI